MTLPIRLDAQVFKGGGTGEYLARNNVAVVFGVLHKLTIGEFYHHLISKFKVPPAELAIWDAK